jgi:alcohol dehydrogenase
MVLLLLLSILIGWLIDRPTVNHAGFLASSTSMRSVIVVLYVARYCFPYTNVYKILIVYLSLMGVTNMAAGEGRAEELGTSKNCDGHHRQQHGRGVESFSKRYRAMTTAILSEEQKTSQATKIMKALVFHGPNQIAIEAMPIPKADYGEAVLRVTLTTICGTDVHILRGEYPVKPGLIVGHEAVGVIHELGPGVTGYTVGDRVLVGAITPCGQCSSCLNGNWSQCGGVPIGGWKFGNTIHGAQAEYLLVPHAQANMAKIPDELRDEQVILLADIASTGFSAAESGNVRLGDSVAVMAQGPIGLCATAGAKLKGAGFIIATESNPLRKEVAFKMGADVVLDPKTADVVANIRQLTGGRGVDVAIEALGKQVTFETALRVLRPGGTLSSLGVYAGKLDVPMDAFAAGIGDYKIVTTLCPGGKERMRRLMELVLHKHVDLTPLLTHSFSLEEIGQAYALFSEQRDGVLKVAIRP